MLQESFAERFVRTYPADAVIFAQGETGREMFVVLAGQVTIQQTSGGKTQDIATLEQGAMFGEMGLVDLAPRSATARAATPDTRLMVVDQPRFIYLVSQQPAFALAVMEVLSERIRTLERRCPTDGQVSRAQDAQSGGCCGTGPGGEH